MFNLEELPIRFQQKIKMDINYILSLGVDGLEQICLFGSLARGDYRWDSDVDLAIITHEPLTDHYLRGSIIDQLDEEVNGVSTDVVFRSINSTDCLSDTFTKLFDRDKVILWQK